jgi:hypothetical protein
MPKELTAFRLEQAQLDGLRILKERDGMSISDQVAKAVDNWLTDKGATFADAQRLFDEFEDGLATASNARELGKFKLPQEFGASLGGRFLAELTRKQMEAVDRFARLAKFPTRAYWDFWREAKFNDGRGLRQAFDAEAIRALFRLMTDPYRPELHPNDPHLRAEKESLFRLFTYGTRPFLVPSVEARLRQMAKKYKDGHEVLVFSGSTLLDAQARHMDQAWIETRVDELAQHHSGKANEPDCRTVAECEAADLDVLVTFSPSLVEQLTPHTAVLLGSAFDCWRRMRVPRGARPRWEPVEGHPLYSATWWRW